MEEIIKKLQELANDVDSVNYDLLVDNANDLLKQLESFADDNIMEEIYTIAAKKESKLFFEDTLKVFASYALDKNSRVGFFKDKLNKIVNLLKEKYKL